MREGRVGNYQIISCIGEGGMGAVYQVEHTLLGRAAAVKVLLPELSKNQEMVNRFFNEARATAQLQHPGIIDVFDFGYAEDGSAFIVMELLHGESLQSRLRRVGALPWPSAAYYTRQIAAALAAAHRAQIVHRDMKPDNVFLIVDRESQQERTKVLDFGIAKLSDTGPTSVVKTRADVVMGTPTYMSPQQCRGAGQVDYRADIYSLGCMLFEMICGRPPFVGEGFGELLAAHMTQPPPAPSQFVGGLPGPLEHLILLMLAKSEADRPQSMEEIVTALDALLLAHSESGQLPMLPAPMTGVHVRHPSVLTGPPGSTSMTTFGGSSGQVTTSTAPRKRSPVPFVLGGVVVVAAAVAAVLMVTQGSGAAPQPTPTTVASNDKPVPKVEEPAPIPTKPKRKIRGVVQLPQEDDDDDAAPADRGRRNRNSSSRRGAARDPASPAERAATDPAEDGATEDAERGAPTDGGAVAASPAPSKGFSALMGMFGRSSLFSSLLSDDWLVSMLGPEIVIKISSSPPGAEVSYDGEVLGKTPLSFNIERGAYVLELGLALPGYSERSVAFSAAVDHAERVELDPLIRRRVITKPPGAELVSEGEVIGTTPLEFQLPKSDQPQAVTLRLAGYLEQTIEIVADKPGTTKATLEREPQQLTHELACDPGCEIFLDGASLGTSVDGAPVRVEFLEQKGQARTYVMKPVGDAPFAETSVKARADRPFKKLIKMPCARRAAAAATDGPAIVDIYDPCRGR